MPESWYPIFLKLTGRTCLVVGGGAVALRKTEALCDAGAAVRVVAPQACADLLRMKNVDVALRPYETKDLAGIALVIAATDDAALNARVSADCAAGGLWCNVVDDPAHCDFILPSVMRQGPLMIAVSTGGAGPTVAAKIRRDLEDQFGPAWAEWLAALADTRRFVQEAVPDINERRKIFQRLAEDDILAAARAGADQLRTKITDVLDRFGLKGHK
jgi:precorrin-2 dehydrogenase/sirohydrochlorin ferrochelatase